MICRSTLRQTYVYSCSSSHTAQRKRRRELRWRGCVCVTTGRGIGTRTSTLLTRIIMYSMVHSGHKQKQKKIFATLRVLWITWFFALCHTCRMLACANRAVCLCLMSRSPWKRSISNGNEKHCLISRIELILY